MVLNVWTELADFDNTPKDENQGRDVGPEYSELFRFHVLMVNKRILFKTLGRISSFNNPNNVIRIILIMLIQIQ